MTKHSSPYMSIISLMVELPRRMRIPGMEGELSRVLKKGWACLLNTKTRHRRRLSLPLFIKLAIGRGGGGLICP